MVLENSIFKWETVQPLNLSKRSLDIIKSDRVTKGGEYVLGLILIDLHHDYLICSTELYPNQISNPAKKKIKNGLRKIQTI